MSMRLQLQCFDQAGKARVGFKEVIAGVYGQGCVEVPGAEDLGCLAGGCADGRKVGTGEFLAVVQRWMREADLMGQLR